MTKGPHKLARLLERNDHLGFLCNKVSQQQKILDELKSQLPAPLDKHCIHARIDGSRMIIHTDTPVWATRLRFHAPLIIRHFSSQAPGLKKVDIRLYLEP